MAAVLAALFIASIASASDEACTRETLRPVGVPAHINVAALFERKVTAADGTVSVEPIEGTEVLIARVGVDGKLVFACVDSAEAARRFFEAPVEKLPARATEK